MEQIEISENHTARLIISGEWLYDGSIRKRVRIFAIKYDFYYDLDEGHLDEGQNPELNGQGEQYVVVWYSGPFFSAPDFPSNGFMKVAEAKSYAESVVQKVEWLPYETKNYI